MEIETRRGKTMRMNMESVTHNCNESGTLGVIFTTNPLTVTQIRQ